MLTLYFRTIVNYDLLAMKHGIFYGKGTSPLVVSLFPLKCQLIRLDSWTCLNTDGSMVETIGWWRHDAAGSILKMDQAKTATAYFTIFYMWLHLLQNHFICSICEDKQQNTVLEQNQRTPIKQQTKKTTKTQTSK